MVPVVFVRGYSDKGYLTYSEYGFLILPDDTVFLTTWAAVCRVCDMLALPSNNVWLRLPDISLVRALCLMPVTPEVLTGGFWLGGNTQEYLAPRFCSDYTIQTMRDGAQ
jgi:hypothetical protein